MNIHTARNELKNPPGISWGLIAVEAAFMLTVVFIAIKFT